MSKDTQPDYRAFTVVKREGGKDFWLPIGAAFKHSGDGYNVVLQALPIPNGDGECKIVLRPPKDDDDRTPQDHALAPDRNRAGARHRS